MSADLAARPDLLLPPPEPGRGRALALALLAHALLLAALTWGVNWRHESDTLAVEAELWSALPRQAAPPPAPPPARPPAPAPEPPAPPPPPQPMRKPVAAPPPAPSDDARQAEIALQRRRAAEAQARAAQAQRELAERERAAVLKQRQAAEEAARRKASERRAAEEAARKQAEAEAAAKKAAQQAAKARAEREAAQRLEAERQENIRRMQGLAGSAGNRNATGRDLQSAGPSASYAGRVAARIRPNIVFTDDAPGNPSAEVEVQAAPDGTILARRLVKSSGMKAWDDAVLKAIDKTERLPADTDGRVPSALIISFRPQG